MRINRKHEVIYAFIDSQNLNLGTMKNVYRHGKLIYKGWKLDFGKFHRYLSDKYRVSKAFLFIGYIPGNKRLYDYLYSSGFELIFRVAIKDVNGKTKGNVDAELIVYTMKYIYEQKCDKVVIVSGDGDFAVLAEFTLEKNKLCKFIAPNRLTMSILIKRIFVKKKKMNLVGYLNTERKRLEMRKPLYRSGHR